MSAPAKSRSPDGARHLALAHCPVCYVCCVAARTPLRAGVTRPVAFLLPLRRAVRKFHLGPSTVSPQTVLVALPAGLALVGWLREILSRGK